MSDQEKVNLTMRFRICYCSTVPKFIQFQTEFSVAAQTVRSKASSIFEHFQEIFDVDSPETFMKAFEQEVKEFKASVEDLPLSKVLGLTEDNGKITALYYFFHL